MKKNFLVLIGLIGVCALVLWLAGRNRREAVPMPPEPAPSRQKPDLATRPTKAPSQPSAVQSATNQQGQPMSDADFEAYGRRAIAEQQARQKEGWERWKAQWDTPIEFYGKVVDEIEVSVRDAAIDFSRVDVHGVAQHSSAISDGSGLFSLTGVRGKDLSVEVTKQGYYTSRRNQTMFLYTDISGRGTFTPDASNPVIFQLRKKGPGTDLVTSQYGVRPNLGIRAPRDGTPVRVDLLSRKVGDAGPLEISQVKPDYAHWQQATEWTFRMAIPDGGFVEYDEEFPFQAPEAGYQPAIQFHFKSGETNWTTTLQKQYYIAFGQPRRYGRLVAETAIEMEGARLTYVINPDGSRYLEPR